MGQTVDGGPGVADDGVDLAHFCLEETLEGFTVDDVLAARAKGVEDFHLKSWRFSEASAIGLSTTTIKKEDAAIQASVKEERERRDKQIKWLFSRACFLMCEEHPTKTHSRQR